MHTRHFVRAWSSIRRWCGRLTLVEVAVVTGIVAILASLVLDDPTAATRLEIEKRIRDWRPSDGDAAEPGSELVIPDMRVAGNWEVRRHFNGSSLAIEELASGRYRVQFKTSGCLGSYKAEREAEFRDGVLTLDKPIAEYLSEAYQKLFAVRVGGTDYLLPTAFVPKFLAAFSSEDSIIDKSGLSRVVYARIAQLP